MPVLEVRHASLFQSLLLIACSLATPTTLLLLALPFLEHALLATPLLPGLAEVAELALGAASAALRMYKHARFALARIVANGTHGWQLD
jgi:hypothetical protein